MTALDRFVTQTRALFAREPDVEQRWTSLDPFLAELLADADVQAAAASWPECRIVDNRVDNLLFYEDPDYGFVINGLVFGEADNGAAGRIHDHAHVYTLYGLLSGHQRIQRYERIDDRSKPDYADIRKTSESACGPGEIDLVRPFEIHSEDTLGERAVAVIVRSELTGGFMQGRYNAATNGYWQGLGPRQTRMGFFPEAVRARG
jgi:hypothetical protein